MGRGWADRWRASTDAEWRPNLAAAGIAGLIVGWVVVIFAVERVQFVVVGPGTQAVAIDAASALARLFAALVLLLFPDSRTGPRLRWVGGGFLVLGLGALVFGALQPLLPGAHDPNVSMYASLVVWTVAGGLIVVGFLPKPVLRPSPKAVVVVVVAGVTVGLGLAGAGALPPLVRGAGVEAMARGDRAILPGLTGWYWLASIVPLGLAVAAVIGALRHAPSGGMRPWLLVAVVLFAGAQLHNLFWPAAYSSVLTTGKLLRLMFSALVAVGGVLELRRIAVERAVQLAAERETTRRLADLAVLKADFTAMVAHELDAPITAIRRSAELLATGPLDPIQSRALATIEAEATLLDALAADAYAAAAVERDDFAVRPRPVSVGALLADAVAFARTLPGDHPVLTEVEADGQVRADPERIGQVLRNLLGNAAKFSPAGAPIALRATLRGRFVRIDVIDHGVGIHPDDVSRIFEKFGRGRDDQGRKVPGVGLGLYLSRRIVQAHGADLAVASTPEVGTTFGFELEAVR